MVKTEICKAKFTSLSSVLKRRSSTCLCFFFFFLFFFCWNAVTVIVKGSFIIQFLCLSFFFQAQQIPSSAAYHIVFQKPRIPFTSAVRDRLQIHWYLKPPW